MRRILATLSSVSSGIFFRYRFEEKIDWAKPYIICANHTSNLDISTMILLLKQNFAFIGKEELMNNFVTAMFFRTIDIPINRESKISSFKAFKRAEEYLKQGISVVIFPEGLIANDYPPVLYPFKNGPFRLAIEQKIPIIPVSICNNWRIMWDDGLKYGSRPGICDIRVRKPVGTAGLTIADADGLRDRVYDMISADLSEYENRSGNGK